jgi:hypothetical protein
MTTRESGAGWHVALAALGVALGCGSGQDIGGESHFVCASDRDCRDRVETPFCVAGTCQAHRAPGDAGGASGAGGQASDGSASTLWPLAMPPPDTLAPARIDDCTFEASPGFAVLAKGHIASLAVTDAHVYFIAADLPCSDVCPYELRRVPRCGGDVETLGISSGGPLTAAGEVVYEERGPFLVRHGATEQTIDAACLKGLSGNAAALYALDTCNHALVRLRHDATEIDVLASGLVPPTHAEPLYATAVGTTVVYFTDGEGIGWWSLEENRGGRLYVTPRSIYDLNVTPDALMASVVPSSGDYTRLEILRVPLDGQPVERVTERAAPIYGDLSRLMTESGAAYFVSRQGIATLAAGASEPVFPIQRTPNHLGVYGGRFYWPEVGGFLMTGRTQRPLVAGQGEPFAPAWETRLGGANSEHLGRMTATPGGEAVLVVNASGDTHLGLEPLSIDRIGGGAVVVKLSSGGVPSWNTVLAPASLPAHGGLRAGCLDVDATGSIVVTLGSTIASTGPVLLRVSDDGAVQRERSGPEGYRWEACALAPNGDAYVVNDPDPAVLPRPTSVALEVLRVDFEGNEVWSSKLGEIAIDGSQVLEATALAADPGGNGAVVVARLIGAVDLGDGLRSSGDGGTTSLVVRIDGAGDLSWSTVLRGGLSQVRMTATGEVVVLGGSSGYPDPLGEGATGAEYPGESYGFLVRFDATGRARWLRWLRGSVQDFALDAAESLWVGSSLGPVEFSPDGPVTGDGAWFAELDPSGLPRRFVDLPGFSVELGIAGMTEGALLGRTLQNSGPDGTTDSDVVVTPGF